MDNTFHEVYLEWETTCITEMTTIITDVITMVLVTSTVEPIDTELPHIIIKTLHGAQNPKHLKKEFVAK